jgi:hypothetical protein
MFSKADLVLRALCTGSMLWIIWRCASLPLLLGAYSSTNECDQLIVL